MKKVNFKVGDLVFVDYNKRHYAEVLEITRHNHGSHEYVNVEVRRLYNEWGEPTNRRVKGGYDIYYLTKVDEDYLKLQKKRYERVIELYEQHKDSGTGVT